jgi:hypothetical protein
MEESRQGADGAGGSPDLPTIADAGRGTRIDAYGTKFDKTV